MTPPQIALITEAMNRPEELRSGLAKLGCLYAPDFYQASTMLPVADKEYDWQTSISQIIGNLFLSSVIVIVHSPYIGNHAQMYGGGSGGFNEGTQYEFVMNFILHDQMLISRTVAWTPSERWHTDGSRFWQMMPRLGITPTMGKMENLFAAIESKLK